MINLNTKYCVEKFKTFCPFFCITLLEIFVKKCQNPSGNSNMLPAKSDSHFHHWDTSELSLEGRSNRVSNFWINHQNNWADDVECICSQCIKSLHIFLSCIIASYVHWQKASNQRCQILLFQHRKKIQEIFIHNYYKLFTALIVFPE